MPWQKLISKKRNIPYWFNESTGESRWTDPNAQGDVTDDAGMKRSRQHAPLASKESAAPTAGVSQTIHVNGRAVEVIAAPPKEPREQFNLQLQSQTDGQRFQMVEHVPGQAIIQQVRATSGSDSETKDEVVEVSVVPDDGSGLWDWLAGRDMNMEAPVAPVKRPRTDQPSLPTQISHQPLLHRSVVRALVLASGPSGGMSEAGLRALSKYREIGRGRRSRVLAVPHTVPQRAASGRGTIDTESPDASSASAHALKVQPMDGRVQQEVEALRGTRGVDGVMQMRCHVIIARTIPRADASQKDGHSQAAIGGAGASTSTSTSSSTKSSSSTSPAFSVQVLQRVGPSWLALAKSSPENKLAWDHVIPRLCGALEAIERLHAAGWLHCDLHADNLCDPWSGGGMQGGEAGGLTRQCGVQSAYRAKQTGATVKESAIPPRLDGSGHLAGPSARSSSPATAPQQALVTMPTVIIDLGSAQRLAVPESIAPIAPGRGPGALNCRDSKGPAGGRCTAAGSSDSDARYLGPARGGLWSAMPPEQFPCRSGAASAGASAGLREGEVCLTRASDVFSVVAAALHAGLGYAPFDPRRPPGVGKMRGGACRNHPLRRHGAMVDFLRRVLPGWLQPARDGLALAMHPDPALRPSALSLRDVLLKNPPE